MERTCRLPVDVRLDLGSGCLGFHAVGYILLNSTINSVCHMEGYRNYDSRAIQWVAWLTGGEGLHNNHHGHPRSPKFSFKASEFDPAWPVIKALILLKLAKPSRTIEEIAA